METLGAYWLIIGLLVITVISINCYRIQAVKAGKDFEKNRDYWKEQAEYFIEANDKQRLVIIDLRRRYKLAGQDYWNTAENWSA